MASHNLMLRAWYWLCNINHYQHHYYLLQAQQLLSHSQETRPMKHVYNHQSAEQLPTNHPNTPLWQNLFQGMQSRVEQLQRWWQSAPLSPQTVPSVSPCLLIVALPSAEASTAAPQPSPPENEAARLQLTPQVRRLCQILAINIEAEQTEIDMTTIKRAYHRRARQTHSDKTGSGNNEAFIKVKEAYQSLQQCHYKQQHPEEVVAEETTHEMTPEEASDYLDELLSRDDPNYAENLKFHKLYMDLLDCSGSIFYRASFAETEIEINSGIKELKQLIAGVGQVQQLIAKSRLLTGEQKAHNEYIYNNVLRGIKSKINGLQYFLYQIQHPEEYVRDESDAASTEVNQPQSQTASDEVSDTRESPCHI